MDQSEQKTMGAAGDQKFSGFGPMFFYGPELTTDESFALAVLHPHLRS